MTNATTLAASDSRRPHGDPRQRRRWLVDLLAGPKNLQERVDHCRLDARLRHGRHQVRPEAVRFRAVRPPRASHGPRAGGAARSTSGPARIAPAIDRPARPAGGSSAPRLRASTSLPSSGQRLGPRHQRLPPDSGGSHRCRFVHLRRCADQARRHNSDVAPRTIRCGRASLVASLNSASDGIGREPRVGGEHDDRSILEPRRPAPARLRQHGAERIGGQRHESGQPGFARKHALGQRPRRRPRARSESSARGRPSRASASAARNACSAASLDVAWRARRSAPTPRCASCRAGRSRSGAIARAR